MHNWSCTKVNARIHETHRHIALHAKQQCVYMSTLIKYILVHYMVNLLYINTLYCL